MKKFYRLYKPILSLLFLCVLSSIQSCRKEVDSEGQNHMTNIASPSLVSEARNWYAKMYLSDPTVSVKIQSTESKQPDFSQLVSPNWDKADQRSEYDLTVLEMPFDKPNKLSVKLLDKFFNKNAKGFTKSSFMFFKLKGKYQAYIRVLASDSAYAEKGLEKFNENTFNHMDPDFAGSVMYFSPKGEFLYGGIYNNGSYSPLFKTDVNSKATQAIKPNLVPDPGSQPGPIGDVNNCTNWFIDTYIDGLLVSSDYVGTTCTSGTGNTGQGGAGGTATPGGGSAEHQLNKNKLPKDNNYNTQVGQMCVFKTIEWISQFFGGGVRDGDVLMRYILDKQLTQPQWQAVISSNGVPSGDIAGLVGDYFNYQDVSNPTFSYMSGSINSGYPMLGVLMQTPTSGHAIMITGYNNAGSIEYFDPQLGKYITTAPGNIQRAIQVTGVRTL